MQIIDVEFRYFVRSGWDGPEKVLQWRKKVYVWPDNCPAGGGANDPVVKPELQWTDWQDVPTVEESFSVSF